MVAESSDSVLIICPDVSFMNDLDSQIIALLKRNARMSVTQMAQELHVSRVTIDTHIKKMEPVSYTHLTLPTKA